MVTRRPVLKALVAALGAAALPARAQRDELDKLFALFAAQGERRKAFIERRHSILFRNPPEQRGTLLFKPPALLERDVTSPKRERVRIDAETVTLTTVGDDGKPLERKAQIAAIPQLGALVTTIRATLAGDINALRKLYFITLAEPMPRWRVEMKPIEEPQAGGVMAIVMAGEKGDVTRIQFTETTGDRTELLLSPVS